MPSNVISQRFALTLPLDSELYSNRNHAYIVYFHHYPSHSHSSRSSSSPTPLMKHEVFLDLADCLKILSFHMLLSLSHVPVKFALINLYALRHN